MLSSILTKRSQIYVFICIVSDSLAHTIYAREALDWHGDVITDTCKVQEVDEVMSVYKRAQTRCLLHLQIF